MQLWALIVDSFRESLDRKIFWVMIMISVMVALSMLCVGFEGDRVSLLFGMFEPETDYFDPGSGLGRSRIVGMMIYGITAYLLGWIGTILMIIATAGVFPSMMQRGHIDVLLSKPISRPKLFLYKYISSMVFVFIQASVFVVMMFLVMGLRWGVWAPGYLLCIPLLVLLFSYLYCVSVAVAVKTRSTVAAILICLGAWMAFTSPQVVLGLSVRFDGIRKHETFYRAMWIANWIPPKTWDIPSLAARWSGTGMSMDLLPESMRDAASPEERDQFDQATRLEEELAMSPLESIGSSLLFEAFVVAGAMWSFSRKDF